MKIIFALCLILVSEFSYDQFAVVYDKDGFCNVRSTAEKKENNVVDRLENGHIVYCFEAHANWINIDYSKNKNELNGEVYKDRVVLVSTYPTIPVFTESSSKITLKKDSIKVIIATQNFDKSKHKLSFYKENNAQLELIDNKKYWGTDGAIPKTAYRSIEVVIGQKKIDLPNSALRNLYEINLYTTQVNYDRINDILYIQSMNSDGAGGYLVIWKIEKGIYKERFVAYGF